MSLDVFINAPRKPKILHVSRMRIGLKESCHLIAGQGPDKAETTFEDMECDTNEELPQVIFMTMQMRPDELQESCIPHSAGQEKEEL